MYIAAPIFYVNGSPHVGHLYTALLGDALARWHRILGHPTLYSIGTDEHGVKVQEAAIKNGKDVQTFCDEVTQTFSDLWRESNLSHDVYIRTTEARHKKAVEHLWNTLTSKGELYLGEFEGWYSVSDETFFTPLQVEDERDSLGNPTGRKIATETGNVVTWLKEPNYKFKLSHFERTLTDWIATGQHVYPPLRAKELLRDISQHGLKDLSVSRLKEKIQWGMPVPGDDDHVIYVWLDALTNYITVCGYPEWAAAESSSNAGNDGANRVLNLSTDPEPSAHPSDAGARNSTHLLNDPSALKKFWPSSYQIVGKDIVKFHAVYWPAFLLAAGLAPPKRVIAHGHWTKERKKIAKSTGNVVIPSEIFARLGVDPVRFVLLRQGGLATDGDYNDEEVQNIITDELVNSLGNLISRVTGRGVNPTGAWPIGSPSHFTEEEHILAQRLTQLPQHVDELYKLCEFGKAISSIFSVLNDINIYLTKEAPWKLIVKPPKKAKGSVANEPVEVSSATPSNVVTSPQPPSDPSRRARYDNNLYLSLEAIRICTLLLQPIIPTLSASTLDYLGIPSTSRNPFDYPFGVNYEIYSQLDRLTGDLFVLVDEREKKQARFESKSHRSAEPL